LDKLVQNNDIDGVERLIAEADKLNGREFYERNAEVREIFTEFITTHPDYVSFMHKWLKERPDSISAQTAMGWHFYHIGWLTRGEVLYRDIYYKARDEMTAYFQEAADLAFKSFMKHPTFSPARDLALLTSQHAQVPQSKRALVYSAMGANEDKHTLDLVLRLYSPNWGGSLRMQKKICKDHEEMLLKEAGYTADMCYADQVLSNARIIKSKALTPELIKWAIGIMDAAPKDKMLGARWEDATSIRPDREEAMQIIADILPKRRDASYYYARQVEEQLDKPGYYKEYKRKQLEQYQLMSKRDPLNPKYLGKPLSKSYEVYKSDPSQENLDTYKKNWENILVYGKYNPDIWITKATAEAEETLNPKNILQVVDAYEHAVILSNYSDRNISTLYGYLTMVRNPAQMVQEFNKMGVEDLGELKDVDVESIFAKTDCPFVRIVRIKKLICDEYQAVENCQGFNGQTTWFDRELEAIREQKICPARMIGSEAHLLMLTKDWPPKY